MARHHFSIGEITQMLAVSSAISENVVLEHKAQQFTSLLLQKIISLGWEAKRINAPIAKLRV